MYPCSFSVCQFCFLSAKVASDCTHDCVGSGTPSQKDGSVACQIGRVALWLMNGSLHLTGSVRLTEKTVDADVNVV